MNELIAWFVALPPGQAILFGGFLVWLVTSSLRDTIQGVFQSKRLVRRVKALEEKLKSVEEVDWGEETETLSKRVERIEAQLGQGAYRSPGIRVVTHNEEGERVEIPLDPYEQRDAGEA